MTSSVLFLHNAGTQKNNGSFMFKARLLLTLLCFVIALPAARADLPLTIEDLLTAEKRWRADVNLVFASSDRRNVDSLYGTIQLGPTQFVTLPVSVGEARQNRDVFALSIGARYGMSLDTELYSRLSGISQSTRTAGADGLFSDDENRFTDAWFGINHRFSNDNDTPALLGFAELALAENVARSGSDLVHGKTMMVGITTYRATDPLVLSLTTGYQYSIEREIDKQEINPGDFFFINPSIAFAVNHEVTLTTGVQMRWQQRDRVNSSSQGIRTTQTKVDLGMGYAWSKRTTIQVNTRFDVSGDGGSEFGMTFLYKFPSRFSINDEEREGGGTTNEANIHKH